MHLQLKLVKHACHECHPSLREGWEMPLPLAVVTTQMPLAKGLGPLLVEKPLALVCLACF